MHVKTVLERRQSTKHCQKVRKTAAELGMLGKLKFFFNFLNLNKAVLTTIMPLAKLSRRKYGNKWQLPSSSTFAIAIASAKY